MIYTLIKKLSTFFTMNNQFIRIYNLNPIKKHLWFTIGENLLRYIDEFEDNSVFEIGQIGDEVSYKFLVSSKLVVTSYDKVDLETVNLDLFNRLKSVLIDYIETNCK
jgi:hypothetical protein